MARFDLLVVGDANPDIVLSGEVEPAFGQAERLAEDANLTIGGSGAIAACGAARLGVRVALCAVVGDDLFGRWMREQLDARGVDVRGLVVDPGRRTGLTIVLSKPGDRAILTFPGTIADLRSATVDRRLLRETRHVHVSSYFLQRGLAPDVPALLDEAHSAGATTSVDPNWDPAENWNGGLTDVLRGTDVFLPNAIEAVRIAYQEDVDRAAVSLAGLAALVVVKLGSQGALAVQGTSLVRVGAVPVEPLDTTGAGDAFDAGFLASWLAGDPLDRALAMGAVCGALSTRSLGGVDGQPTLDEARSTIAGQPAGSS